jgi:LPXTG-motif cell wall-anchored protein
MKSATCSRKTMCHLLGAGALYLALAFATNAQVQTQTKSTPIAAPTTSVKVERGTIVYVNGNNVVVKAEDGKLVHFDNVPDTTTVTVGGKQLNVHQLTPGMQVERQTITTTVPKMITTIKTVSGIVWNVNPPSSVILRMENGKNQRFKIPDGQKFNVGGEMKDAWSLRKGMKVDAQQVTEVSQTEVETQVKRTGIAPPPPPAPPNPDVAILILVVPTLPVQTASAAPAEVASAAPAEAEPTPTRLPKTGSDFPLVGLLGALSIALGLGLKAVRTRNT